MEAELLEATVSFELVDVEIVSPPHNRIFCFLQFGNHGIAPAVEFRIFNLIFGMGKNIFNCLADTLVEADSGAEVGNGTLQFAVVEHHGLCLVAKKTTCEIVVADSRQKI